MLAAHLNYELLSVNINCTEVYYISFPRFSGNYLSYFNLDKDQKDRLDKAYKIGQEIADRFNKDGRINPSGEELRKAFNRTFNI
jgi:hypothetical protein